MRMPFGAHKGQALSQLPADYLEWLTTIDLREPLKSAVTQEWHARRDPAKPDLLLARHVIDTGFRALAKTSHPDHGGDTRTMQTLNSTVAWLRRQVEALTCVG